MAKVVRYKLTVEGSGEFPHDMLRYDACYPYDECDSYKLNYSATCEGNMRRVVLIADKHKGWGPTYRRWESFTWRVVSVEIVP